MMIRQTDPCPCGSGKKFRNCCLPQMMMMGMVNQGHDHYSEERENGVKEKVKEVYEPTREEIMKASPEERVNIAAKLFSLDREKEGIEILEMVLYKKEGKVDFVDVFFKVIDYYKRERNYQRALLFCDELLKYDSQEKGGKFSSEVSRVKGEILIGSGKVDEGIKTFEKLIEEDPNELWNYYGISNALVEAGREVESIKYMKKGIDLPVKDIEKVKVLLRRMLGRVNNKEE